ncbi:MAG: beta-ketoacyl-[acyl-carrier-protein] synthase family protein [Hyphomicrobium sp.]
MPANCSSTSPRVVVTGMGVVTPIGQSVPDFWSSLQAGKCGIGPFEGADCDKLDVRIVAQVNDFNLAARLTDWRRDKSIAHSGRFCWLAAAAADEAIKQSRLETPFADAHRVACIMGSAAGGHLATEIAARDRYIAGKRAVHPMLLPRTVGSSAPAHIGIEYGVKGPTFGVCSAGASAAHAIALGCDFIRMGAVDVAIVGGTESTMTYSALLACEALRMLSPDGCFPFSARRNGTVLAEGAAVLILESDRHAAERGARMLAELCGVGLATGHDMLAADAQPERDAMQRALDDAKVAPDSIGYINANGLGTVRHDLEETRAIKSLFGKHAYELGVSSTKSMHGHPIGAAPAFEAVACVKALEDGVMPPTIGLEEADPECDLDYVPGTARKKKLAYAMSNSFALGAMNASLVFGALPA